MKPKAWGKLAILAILVVAIVSAVTLRNSGAPSTGQPSATSATTETAAETPGATGLPRLLELGSDSCRPCQMMQPILAELRTEYPGKLQVDFIDVWKDESAGQRYGVQAIPTQIFFDAKGKELFRHVGFYPKEEILAKFKELGILL